MTCSKYFQLTIFLDARQKALNGGQAAENHGSIGFLFLHFNVSASYIFKNSSWVKSPLFETLSCRNIRITSLISETGYIVNLYR